MVALDDLKGGDTGRNMSYIILVVSIVMNLVPLLLMRLSGSQMYPFFTFYYLWVAGYAILLSAVLFWQWVHGRPLASGRVSVVLVIASLILLRLVFVNQTETISLDSYWYLDFGKFMLMGQTPYLDFYFPYPPVFGYFILMVSIVAPSPVSFRILATIADVGVAIVLWRLAELLTDKNWASLIFISYAFLPLSVIESGWNGHFEPLANLFLLLAIWLMYKNQSSVSGICLGLGIATKFYPVLLFPLMIFRPSTWRERFKFAISTALAFAMPYSPILPRLLLSRSTSYDIARSLPTNNPSPLEFAVEKIVAGFNPITLLIGLGIILGIIVSVRSSYFNSKSDRRSPYYWTVFLLGITFVLLGLVVALYPFFPQARFVFWRYPVDVAIVRGVTTISVGLLILWMAIKYWSLHQAPPTDVSSLLSLIAGTILLLLPLSRSVFYGWYLLWSIPLFLTSRDKKLVLTVLLCLLLLYPSYTHDNFNTLGYSETSRWTGDLTSSDDWSVAINTTGSPLNPSMISGSVKSGEDGLHFEFNTSKVTDSTLLENTSISYTTEVSFNFTQDSDFAARILSLWDPTFGAYAEFELSYLGFNDEGRPINGTIIPRTTIFTNLTSVLWKHAFSIDGVGLSGVVQQLVLTIYPCKTVVAEYIVTQLYTTSTNILNPFYFLTVPNLIAISLIGYISLHIAINRYELKSDRSRKLYLQSRSVS